MFEEKLLDHGYIKTIEHWGSDERIVESARMSTSKGFLGWGAEETCDTCKGSGTNEPENGPGSLCKVCRGRKVAINKPGDEKLLKFLYENKHSTPFEMAGLTIEVQAPIFVFREWHRHRVPFSYSEMSARYTPLPDLNYVPTVERLLMNSKTNKQAGTVKDAAELDEDAAAALMMEERDLNRMCEDFYQRKLKAGVPKELARTHLAVSRYSRMRASANLRGWLAFMTLRSAPSAQYEIRVYSQALGRFIAQIFPRTWALFDGKA